MAQKREAENGSRILVWPDQPTEGIRRICAFEGLWSFYLQRMGPLYSFGCNRCAGTAFHFPFPFFLFLQFTLLQTLGTRYPWTVWRLLARC